MRFKFLHFSDAHLGYQQYGSDERFNDFGRAFAHVIDHALEQQVDFVIFSGDLFQKRSIDPPTLIQAVNNLDRLREAGIPVLAVEGNHERAHYRDKSSWLDFLAERGYLILLNPDFEGETAHLQHWDGLSGAYVDLVPGQPADLTQPAGGDVVRICGMKFYGAATRPTLERFITAVGSLDQEPVAYTILMMHAGMEGELDNMSGTIPQSAVAPLKDYVNYLALGHIHKPYQREDWIFNPGSLETCSTMEAAWPERGCYLVTVDTERQPSHDAQLKTLPRRPFVRIFVKADTCDTPEAVYALVEKEVAAAISSKRLPKPPVVEVTLTGTLRFSLSSLSMDDLRAAAERAAGEVLLLRTNNRTVPHGFEIEADESQPRAEVERQVIRELLTRDVRFQSQAGEWAALVLEMKRMILDGSAPEDISAYVASRSAELESASFAAEESSEPEAPIHDDFT
jgi:DNA repair protein SbcD/Mre11